MFFKKLTSLWSRGVKRAIKLQARTNKKAVKKLLAKPPAKIRRKPSPTPPPVRPATISLTPGKWLKSHQPNAVLDSGAMTSRMSYWLYLPDRPATANTPLVVMLHGCAQTATQFAQGTRMNVLAEEKGFAVLYPQRPAAGDPSRCWHWYKKAVQQGGGEVPAIVGIIEEVIVKYALDQSRIYIAGISAGANMANIVALNHPELIAAVGIHSGAVFGAVNTSVEGYGVMQRGSMHAPRTAIKNFMAEHKNFPGMPAILIHGKNDTVVRPVNLDQLSQQFRELNHLAGADDKPVISNKSGGPRSGNAYTTSDYHVGNKLILKVCEIEGLDHAWSGGGGAVRYSEPNGPDAGKLMWSFFVRHKRRAGRATRIFASATPV